MKFETIIIGLGAMGSAAAFQLAKKGNKVCGIDRFMPPHDLGSTHGETRVTRKAIGEGAEYVPLTLRSYEIFREIESKTGLDLLTITGGLVISGKNGTSALHGSSGFIRETVAAAQQFGIDHRLLSARQIAAEFPQFNLEGDEIGYFEDDMGFLRPEKCVGAQIELARRYGANIQLNEKVLEVKPRTGDFVEVVTDKGVYLSEKLIISAGPWIRDFVETPYRNHFKIFRQVFYWFDVADSYQNFRLGKFPIFIWEFGRWENDFVYGFPAIDGRNAGFKIATETYFSTTDPDSVNRQVSSTEIDDIYERYVRHRFNGVSKKCLKTSTCLYTVTPESRFLIDRLPGDERIIVASPCSGHGFKHSAAIGEILAELVTVGKSSIDISAFSFDKF